MKKVFISLLILLLFFFSSCSDYVDPLADIKEDYVCYCVLNADTTFQTAYLSQAYSSGLNPLDNTTDPAIKKASIVVTYKNTNYLLSDSSVGRTDTSRYKNDFQFYYTNKLNLKSEKMYDVAYPISITVTLPNNKVLKAETETIPTGDLLVQETYDAYDTRPDVYERFKVFSWDFWSSKNSLSKYYFLPVLEINYSKIENGIPVRKKVQIPSYTYMYSNVEYYGYPKVSKDNFIIYSKEHIINTFKSISADDPVKSNYIIHNVMMTVIVMDKSVAAGYAQDITYDSEFSVRIDAPDVSNVDGGYGLFGLYAKKKKELLSYWFEVIGYGYQYEHKL
jgi:hypothetical protein